MEITDNKRKCLYCKGIMEADHCNHMIDLDGRFIIIREVPCHKCLQCGKISYSGEVVAQIERIVIELRNAKVEVAVVEYRAA